MSREKKGIIEYIMQIKFTDNLGNYLGVLLLNDHPSKRHFQYVVEKVQMRLTGWRAKNLNMAGRNTLIQ